MEKLTRSSRGAVATGAAATGASTTGAAQLGALALGAAALGAVAVGALAIGRLSVGRARLRRVEIGALAVGRLDVGALGLPGEPAAFARLRALPGQGDAFERLLAAGLPARGPQALALRVYRSHTDPDLFLFHGLRAEAIAAGADAAWLEGLLREAAELGLVEPPSEGTEVELWRSL